MENEPMTTSELMERVGEFSYHKGYLAGAEAMRERAAKLMEEKDHNHGYRLGNKFAPFSSRPRRGNRELLRLRKMDRAWCDSMSKLSS